MAKNPIDTLTDQAEKKYRSQQFLEAARLYQQAGDLCAQRGDLLLAAEMANNRSVALLQGGDAQHALEAALGTDQVFAQAGDARRQGLALGNQAAALEALGRLDEAMQVYWQSSELLKQAGDQETRAYLLQCISALQIRTGHQLEALATMDAALAHKKKLSLKEQMLKKFLRIPIDMVKRGG